MNTHITLSEIISFVIFMFIILGVTAFALVALIEANDNHDRYDDSDNYKKGNEYD